MRVGASDEQHVLGGGGWLGAEDAPVHAVGNDPETVGGQAESADCIAGGGSRDGVDQACATMSGESLHRPSSGRGRGDGLWFQQGSDVMQGADDRDGNQRRNAPCRQVENVWPSPSQGPCPGRAVPGKGAAARAAQLGQRVAGAAPFFGHEGAVWHVQGQLDVPAGEEGLCQVAGHPAQAAPGIEEGRAGVEADLQGHLCEHTLDRVVLVSRTLVTSTMKVDERNPVVVALDGKPAMGARTGVGRVVEGLLEGLEAVEPGLCDLRLLRPNRSIPTLPWVQVALPFLSRGADVLHCPFYYRPWLSPCPTVVSVFDLLVLTHPEWFPPRGRRPFADLLRWSLRSSDAVVTAAESVLAEIEELIGPLHGRGVAIPLGVDAARFHPVDEEQRTRAAAGHGLERPFLLHVGSLHPRRGIGTALAALELLHGDRPELELVVVGKREYHTPQPGPSLAPRVRFLGYVPEQDLPALFSSCEALLSLSHGEGFDLPLLEGLACGAPVVASDIGVHREHFSTWTRMVPAGDARGVADSVESLLSRPPGVDARTLQIRQVTERFSWQAAARAHLDLWRAVGR